MNRFLFGLVLVVVVVFLTENCMSRSVQTNGLNVRTLRQASTIDDISLTSIVNFTTPNPTFVALLGQMMVFTTKVDFSLTNSGPLGGFKYVKHPESFRASLVQLSNQGYETFMSAQQTMLTIQSSMKQVPSQIKTVIQVVSNGSATIIEHMLPAILVTIQGIRQTSVKLSTETDSKLANTLLLMNELLEALLASQGHREILAEVKTEPSITLGDINWEEISFKDLFQVFRMLRNQLSNIEEYWNNLSKFSPLWVSSELTLNQTINSISWKDIGTDDRQFLIGMLKDYTRDISKVASYYYALSSTYVDVSTKYLLNRWTDLAKILAIDNDVDRNKMMNDLKNQVKEGVDAMKEISKQRLEESSHLFDIKSE